MVFVAFISVFLLQQIERQNGWINVGDLQGAVHFKIGKSLFLFKICMSFFLSNFIFYFKAIVFCYCYELKEGHLLIYIINFAYSNNSFKVNISVFVFFTFLTVFERQLLTFLHA